MMNAEQYGRWRDFAQRMALKGWTDLTDARKQKLHKDVTEFIEFYGDCYEGIGRWDGGKVRLCDDFEETFNESASDRAQLSCCIRAGVDVATDNCYGVLGFTIGDVRRMYDGQLPEWFADLFEEPVRVLAADDDTAIWL